MYSILYGFCSISSHKISKSNVFHRQTVFFYEIFKSHKIRDFIESFSNWRASLNACQKQCLTSAGPSGAVGTKSGPLGPSEDLGAPQKGFSGQNRALLRPPGAQKGPDIRSKCVLTMSLTQAGQWGAVGTKSGPHGPPRTSGAPKRAFWSQNEPFWGP